MKDLTQEQQDDVVSRYERGQTIAFIRFATEIPGDAIVALLKARGVRIRRARGGSSWGWTGIAAALLALSVVVLRPLPGPGRDRS
jgi:hypothetical protein